MTKKILLNQTFGQIQMDKLKCNEYKCCPFHLKEQIEFMCVAKECFFIRGGNESQCQGRLGCIRCVKENHTNKCGLNCYTNIFKPIGMPKDLNPICQKILDFAEESNICIDIIDRQFNDLKKSLVLAVDSAKKHAICSIHASNQNIYDMSHEIQNKWNFTSILSELMNYQEKNEDAQIKRANQKWVDEVENLIRDCYETQQKTADEFLSSGYFQLFSNIQIRVEELKERLVQSMNGFSLDSNNDKKRSQEYSFVAICNNLDLESTDQHGYQVIRTRNQSYVESFISEDMDINKTYELLIQLSTPPSNSVTIGLAQLTPNGIDKKMSQSLVNSYNKHMGFVSKGVPLFNLSNNRFRIIANISKNQFQISDENQQNIISLAPDIHLSTDRLSHLPNTITSDTWRILLTLFEPPLTITVLKAIKY